MPELPEVETIKNQLQKLVGKKTISSVDIFLPKIVKTSLAQFKKIVPGKKIKNIKRRAKIFVFELSGNFSLVIHLKMTGQLIFVKNKKALKQKQNKHSHFVFYFSDDSALIFNDLRQFGYVKLVPTKKVAQEIQEKKLGPEPLGKSFTQKKLREILKTRPKKKIKQFLTDPFLIAGIGNIYSDEILFLSRVQPTRQVKTLKQTEIEAIFKNIKRVLKEAIWWRGTSASDYLDARGQEGGYDKKLRVYGREGQQCPRGCGEVKRIKIGGRSAHFCPKCQK